MRHTQKLLKQLDLRERASHHEKGILVQEKTRAEDADELAGAVKYGNALES